MPKTPCILACFAMLALGARAQTMSSPAARGIDDDRRQSTPPRILHADPVSYPADPGLARVRHTCVVSVTIGKDGKTTSAELENTRPSPFDAGALASVKNATFSPANMNGEAVGARTQVWVEFRGDGQAAIPTTDPGPNFERPRPTVAPIAEYTDDARRSHIRGSVLLSFIVTETGAVTDIRVLRHLAGGLDDQSVKTVKQWRFVPAMVDGEPVPDRIRTAMSFNIR